FDLPPLLVESAMRYTVLALVYASFPWVALAQAPDDPVPPASANEGASAFPGVQDETPGIRAEEREAFHRLLEQANSAESAELRAAADQFAEKRRADYAAAPGADASTFSVFFDLLRNPDRYRGQPVAMSGRLREL